MTKYIVLYCFLFFSTYSQCVFGNTWPLYSWIIIIYLIYAVIKCSMVHYVAINSYVISFHI